MDGIAVAFVGPIFPVDDDEYNSGQHLEDLRGELRRVAPWGLSGRGSPERREELAAKIHKEKVRLLRTGRYKFAKVDAE